MYTLDALTRVLGMAHLQGDPHVVVSGVEYDSRRVESGQVFICVPGLKVDGHEFANAAVENGCAALVVERFMPQLAHVPQMVVKSARRALARLGAVFCGRPADEMTIVGITGTNGKTTASHFCEAVLKNREKNCGLIGTIHSKIGGQSVPMANTTPESLHLHQMLREMRNCGQDAAVMEVSSHALELERVHNLPFDVAVFTNLTHDHLDFHGTMEAYYEAKLKLFKSLSYRKGRCAPYAVINVDDPYGRRMISHLKVPYITYGTDPSAHLRALDIEASLEGVSYTLDSPLGEMRVNLGLSGMFNVFNSLAAVGVGIALKGELQEIVNAVESVARVSGRFELVREGQDFSVVVDYAHTPDGLENLLQSARQVATGQLITVFGCGGDRDRAKRPVMGEIAARLSDMVVLTSDNPRSEDPEQILAEIQVGLHDSATSWEIEVERSAAIFRAISLASPGDIVVIAGKGHETYQLVGSEVLPFDDREVARKALRGRALRAARPRVQASIWTDRRRMSASAEMNAVVVNES